MKAVILMLVVGWLFLLEPSPLEGFDYNPEVEEYIKENKYNLDYREFKSVEDVETYIHEYKIDNRN